MYSIILIIMIVKRTNIEASEADYLRVASLGLNRRDHIFGRSYY